MEPDDFGEYQWDPDNKRFVHKPRGRACNYTITPMEFETLRTCVVIARHHNEQCHD